MDVIRIHRLELDCIVGIRPSEREHQQRVRLDLGLHADVSEAGRTGRISLTADYDQVAHEAIRVDGHRRLQDLDRDIAIEFRVVRAVDLSHAACAHEWTDVVTGVLAASER